MRPKISAKPPVYVETWYWKRIWCSNTNSFPFIQPITLTSAGLITVFSNYTGYKMYVNDFKVEYVYRG